SPITINTIGCFARSRLMPRSAGGLAVAVFMQLSHGRLARCGRCPAITLLLLDVALKEIVEERTDDGDCAEAPDGLPARADRGFDYVGRELKGERRDQPPRVAQPDSSRLLVSEWLDRGAKNVDGPLGRPHHDDEQRKRIVADDYRVADEAKPLSHVSITQPRTLLSPETHSL